MGESFQGLAAYVIPKSTRRRTCSRTLRRATRRNDNIAAAISRHGTPVPADAPFRSINIVRGEVFVERIIRSIFASASGPRGRYAASINSISKRRLNAVLTGTKSSTGVADATVTCRKPLKLNAQFDCRAGSITFTLSGSPSSASWSGSVRVRRAEPRTRHEREQGNRRRTAPVLDAFLSGGRCLKP